MLHGQSTAGALPPCQISKTLGYKELGSYVVDRLQNAVELPFLSLAPVKTAALT